jgi:hypothetical protein
MLTMKPPENAYKKQTKILKEIVQRKGRATDLFGIEHLVVMVLCAWLMLMPAMFVRWYWGRKGYFSRKIAVEVYAIAKPAVLGGLLLWARSYPLLSIAVAVFFLLDLYSYLLGLVLLRTFYTKPASATRSLVMLGVNFVESVLAFAVLFGATSSVAPAGTQVADLTSGALIYFSLVTAATVGYGDLVPIGPAGRFITIVEIASSLAFISVFVSSFVGNLGTRSGGETKSHPGNEAAQQGVAPDDRPRTAARG